LLFLSSCGGDEAASGTPPGDAGTAGDGGALGLAGVSMDAGDAGPAGDTSPLEDAPPGPDATDLPDLPGPPDLPDLIDTGAPPDAGSPADTPPPLDGTPTGDTSGFFFDVKGTPYDSQIGGNIWTSDNFDLANGTALTQTNAAFGGTPQPWAIEFAPDSWRVQDGQAESALVTPVMPLLVSLKAPSANCTIEVDTDFASAKDTKLNNMGGLVFRAGDASNFWFFGARVPANAEMTQYTLYRIGGAPSDSGTVYSVKPQKGDRLVVELEAGKITGRVVRDGQALGFIVVMDTSPLVSEPKVGLYCYFDGKPGARCAFDNFGIGGPSCK